MAFVAKAVAAFEGGLTSSHIGGDFLGELCAEGFEYPQLSSCRALGTSRQVCLTLSGTVFPSLYTSEAPWLRRPIVNGQTGQLIHEAVLGGGPSGGSVGDFLIHHDWCKTLHFAAQPPPNRTDCGEAKDPTTPYRVFMDARLAQ